MWGETTRKARRGQTGGRTDRARTRQEALQTGTCQPYAKTYTREFGQGLVPLEHSPLEPLEFIANASPVESLRKRA